MLLRFHLPLATLVVGFLLPLEISPAQAPASTPKGEPTNAAEAAARKAAQMKELDEKFAAWKATLPEKRQQWESVLEANLGSFYLPLYKSDKVKGAPTAWDYVEDDPALPRVLLVGDSVSRGYTLAVRAALKGKANVHRAPENCGPVANGLKKLDIWLGTGSWDVIHFNFGIHDRATPNADYLARLEQFVTRLKATGARIIWASTTPIPPDTRDGSVATQAIVEKNALALDLMKKHAVAVDDLYALVFPKLGEVQNPKDVHFSNEGYTLLGGQVAASILEVLR